jgi:peptidoglycan/xylan/chitin deacetylase (PgdA/CDA1 family)
MMGIVNARTVVLLTFDFDAESAQVRKTPHLPVTLSKGQFARVGVDRILRLLDRYGIRATFFTPAWTARQYSELVHEIVQRGHEIAAHGYLHENLSELDENKERGVHEKSMKMLAETAGKKPVGFRAPYWEWSQRTLGFLRKYQFAYDSSLMNDDKPYLMESSSGTEIYELPVEWFLDDWALFEERRQSPGMVFEAWKSEFDAVHELGIGYFMLTMHPECIGRASRMCMLEQLVNHIRAKNGIEFARCDELVEHLRFSSRRVQSSDA